MVVIQMISAVVYAGHKLSGDECVQITVLVKISGRTSYTDAFHTGIIVEGQVSITVVFVQKIGNRIVVAGCPVGIVVCDEKVR